MTPIKDQSLDDAVLEHLPEVEHIVLNVGFLIHRLNWSEEKTLFSIADEYASFKVRDYGKDTIVFEVYNGGPNTKLFTHQRRRKIRTGNKVNIAEGTQFVRKKGGFPSNVDNSLL